MQKQTQTYAEKVRQEEQGHTRGPPFMWAYLGLVKSLQQRGNAVAGHSGILGQTGTALSCANLRRGAFLQAAGQNVQSTHQESDAEHCFPGEAAPHSRSTEPNRVKAQVRTGSTFSYGKRAASVPGRSAEDVKIIVKTFLAEKGLQANSKAWHNAMQSEHVKRMATAQGEVTVRFLVSELRGETCQTTR